MRTFSGCISVSWLLLALLVPSVLSDDVDNLLDEALESSSDRMLNGAEEALEGITAAKEGDKKKEKKESVGFEKITPAAPPGEGKKQAQASAAFVAEEKALAQKVRGDSHLFCCCLLGW
jgi:hypothetical protein